MKVTNLMENFVKANVDDMYDRIKSENPASLICDCENCRTDTLCYVLNRVPPKYTISARGVNHAQREFENYKQISADVDTVIMEGIRLISSSKRPNHNSAYNAGALAVQEKKPYFFFPIISGYVYDGTTFESLTNATVTLLLDGKLAKMMDSTWQNPYNTFKATEGSYNFFVTPQKTTKEGVSKDFNFIIKVEALGYDELKYSFSIPIASKILNGENPSNYSLKIQDLFLFPKGLENPMERYPASGV